MSGEYREQEIGSIADNYGQQIRHKPARKKKKMNRLSTRKTGIKLIK